jgi:hypothetical protein
LNGSESLTITKGDAYTDAGATANDDEDGSITVTSTASSTNPDVNAPGVYTITYTATDKAGNVATAVRTVIVSWSAAQLMGPYTNTEHDSLVGVGGADSTFTSFLDTASSSIYDFKFYPVSVGFTNPIYCHIVDGNKIVIDAQYPNGSGSPFLLEGVGEGTITQNSTHTFLDFVIKNTDTGTSLVLIGTIHAGS